MSPTLALSYATFYGLTFEDAIAAALEQGFRSVQLIPDQTPNLAEEFGVTRRCMLRELAAKSQIEISLHNVFYDINLTSVVPAVAQSARAITNHTFLLARDLGATCVVIHPGYMFPGWRRDERQRKLFWRNARQSLLAICDDAAACGIRALFENGSYCLTTVDQTKPIPLHLAITPDEISQLLEIAERRVGICLDVNKALRSGHKLHEFVDAAGSSLEQLQMSTVQDRWAEIEPLLILLRQQGFAGTIVLEGSVEETRNGYRLLTDFLG